MSKNDRIERAATATIKASPGEVFAAVTDITRIGDRSPECVACRWVDGSDGPEVGARFSGDNVVRFGPITAKRWTTTSVVTASEPGRVFEFIAEEFTTWRYEMEPVGDGATRVTESVSYPPGKGFQGFLYERVLNRPDTIQVGMERTLEAIKTELEG